VERVPRFIQKQEGRRMRRRGRDGGERWRWEVEVEVGEVGGWVGR